VLAAARGAGPRHPPSSGGATPSRPAGLELSRDLLDVEAIGCEVAREADEADSGGVARRAEQQDGSAVLGVGLRVVHEGRVEVARPEGADLAALRLSVILAPSFVISPMSTSTPNWGKPSVSPRCTDRSPESKPSWNVIRKACPRATSWATLRRRSLRSCMPGRAASCPSSCSKSGFRFVLRGDRGRNREQDEDGGQSEAQAGARHVRSFASESPAPRFTRYPTRGKCTTTRPARGSVRSIASAWDPTATRRPTLGSNA